MYIYTDNTTRYPATAALTTGYPFRIENPSTVYFLQRISLTGHLTTLSISPPSSVSLAPLNLSHVPSILTILALAFISTTADVAAAAMLSTLILARLLNVIAVRRRAYRGSLWKGAPEPGVRGDLLVLLTQDRWVRLQGFVDDLKAVTSGTWLADPTSLDSCLSSLSKLLVYLAVALGFNATQIGSLVVVGLLLANTVVLAIVNGRTRTLKMYERVVKVGQEPVGYKRRRDLADQLIQETGRRDWAVALGMVPVEEAKGDKGVKATM